MTPVTCTIEPDELLGLSALVELDRAAAGGGTFPPAPTRYAPRRRCCAQRWRTS